MKQRAANARIALLCAALASAATDGPEGPPPLLEQVGPELALIEGEVTTGRVDLVADAVEEGTRWTLYLRARSRTRFVARPEFRLRVLDAESGEVFYDETADEHFYRHDRVCDEVPGCGAELELELEVDSSSRASVEWDAWVESSDLGIAGSVDFSLGLQTP